MLDAHIHLQNVDDDTRKELISYVGQRKFFTLFCNGTSPGDWKKVFAIADMAENVKPFVGVHPWYVDDLPGNWEQDLIHFLHHHQCGVGEIGLDNTSKGGNFERQKILFVRQLDTAIMFGRVFMLHCVGAWGPMMAILRTYELKEIPFILHSFIGSHEILSELLGMGAMISISERSLRQKKAQEIVQAVPDEQILLETDFPYLPGRDKEQVGVEDYQQAIKQVYEQTAEIRNVSVEQIAVQVRENARKVLKYITNEK